MINSRSQLIKNSFDRIIRFDSRQSKIVNNQLNENLLNNISRIEKLEKNKQFVDELFEIVLRNNDQIIDNSRIVASDVDDDEKFDNIDQRDENNTFQNVDFDDAKTISSKKFRTFFYTLSNNFANILTNNHFRNNVNKNVYDVFKMQLLKMQNKSFEFRLNVVEKNLNNIDHRREHNDDHYRRDAKRTNKREKLKKQFVINYSNLIN